MVSIHLVESIRDILGKMFSRTKRNKQMKDDERAFINLLFTTACYRDMKDINGLTK